MRKKQGFTLVELLVVMAIIAILAAIVVPNASKFIGRARVTRALSEIAGMETAVTAMLTDAGRSSLGQVFTPGAVPALVVNGVGAAINGKVVTPVEPGAWSTVVPANFEAITMMYSNVVYDLLRYGRDVLRQDGSVATDATAVIDRNLLSKLGTSYMDLGNDSWGSQYRIFPGPWKFASAGGANRWPIIFRKFSVDTGTSGRKAKDDGYSLKNPDRATNPDLVSTTFSSIVEDADTWPDKVGFPADAGKSMYVWSLGENMRNGQMLYSATYDATNAFSWYNNPQDGSDLGGGDDVNNWDKDSTWARFTN